MKRKYLLSFLFVCLTLALFKYNTALALEISYPSILGLPSITPNSGLGDFVRYWFGLIVYAAAILSIVSFAAGAVQLGISAASPEGAKGGKDRMIGSVIGLILAVSSFVVLRTINPILTNPDLTDIPLSSGVFLSTSDGYSPAPTAVEDVSEVGYGELAYKCGSAGGVDLIVWLFSNKNLDYSGGTQIRKVQCGGSVSVSSSGSFKWEYETPGVYYCMDGCSGNLCSGYMSGAITSSQDEIEDPFKGHIKGIRIVNDTGLSEYYGAILHEEIGLDSGGACTQPIYFNNSGGCTNVNIPAYAADIFSWNKGSPQTSGDGLTLYSETYGWNADVQSGFYNIPQSNINNFYNGNTENFKFDWTNIESTDAALCNEYPDLSCWEENPSGDEEDLISYGACCPCINFQDCPGSIRVKGNYVVGLYSDAKDEEGNNFLYCQTFRKDVENLNAYDYTQPDEYIKYINIIPTN